jgi:anti-sigma factor RsiW
MDDEDVRRDLEATVAARRELGAAHDKELIEGFLERIDKEIDRRVDERIRRQRPRGAMSSPLNPATLGVCIPIIAIAGAFAGPFGVGAVIAALVLIFAIESRR